MKLIFGIKGFKVYCKVCVVEWLEEGRLKWFFFISIGNFNEFIVRIYIDYMFFMVSEKIGKEINKVFSFFEVNY